MLLSFVYNKKENKEKNNIKKPKEEQYKSLKGQ